MNTQEKLQEIIDETLTLLDRKFVWLTNDGKQVLNLSDAQAYLKTKYTLTHQIQYILNVDLNPDHELQRYRPNIELSPKYLENLDKSVRATLTNMSTQQASHRLLTAVLEITRNTELYNFREDLNPQNIGYRGTISQIEQIFDKALGLKTAHVSVFYKFKPDMSTLSKVDILESHLSSSSGQLVLLTDMSRSQLTTYLTDALQSSDESVTIMVNTIE